MIPWSWLRWWGHRRWIRFGLRDRLLRLLVPPESMRGNMVTVDFFGWRYRGDLGSFVDWNVYFYGAYELGILQLLARAADMAGPEVIFLDVGANVGQHSLFMARHADQVHAFEPWATARQRLEDMLVENAVGNVHVHGYALGESERDLPFYAPASANLGTGSFCPDVNDNRSVGRLRVRRGDDVVAELGLSRVDVIKIDTEGFEAQVLAGFGTVLSRFAPVIVVEISLAAHGRVDVAGLFPSGWTLLMADSHPERCQLRPFDPSGLNMVTVIAGPRDKISRLAAAWPACAGS